MLDPRRILIPALACVCVGACVDNPVSARSEARNAASAGPMFDGGHMLGSGAFVDTTSATTAATMDAAAAGDTTGRGGHMLGSGA
jgi:hypothetical protein